MQEKIPDLPQIEGARLLGNDARERLHADGFDDEQIDAWAETFIAEVGSGTSTSSWLDRPSRNAADPVDGRHLGPTLSRLWERQDRARVAQGAG